jgi:hypothetical protein
MSQMEIVDGTGIWIKCERWAKMRAFTLPRAAAAAQVASQQVFAPSPIFKGPKLIEQWVSSIHRFVLFSCELAMPMPILINGRLTGGEFSPEVIDPLLLS